VIREHDGATEAGDHAIRDGDPGATAAEAEHRILITTRYPSPNTRTCDISVGEAIVGRITRAQRGNSWTTSAPQRSSNSKNNPRSASRRRGRKNAMLLRSEGRYADDNNVARQAYAVMVRSHLAHGIIRGIEND
jgi:hypothetical protein